jgi:hypothetical protein
MQPQQFNKELWIFWFEKEEPPNLRSLISADLQPDQSSNSTCPNTTATAIDSKDILANASSSHNGLPYECRSMLFKALHNLIERSLLAKGYARLGKWFVMPYNLNAVNYSYNTQFNVDHRLHPQATNAATATSNSGHAPAKSLYSTTSAFYKLGIDDSNHVSYMFNFFLHGASRVCTSVDMKMHKPIRSLNQFDLIKLKNVMKRKLRITRTTTTDGSKSSGDVPFKGLKCLLGPYGLSARLLGYVVDESTEAKVTVSEWQQFYPTTLLAGLPHVFVVGVGEANRVKLFYPSCFVYVVMDGAADLSDDELNYDEAGNTDELYDDALLSDSSLNTLNSIERYCEIFRYSSITWC